MILADKQEDFKLVSLYRAYIFITICTIPKWRNIAVKSLRGCWATIGVYITQKLYATSVFVDHQYKVSITNIITLIAIIISVTIHVLFFIKLNNIKSVINIVNSQYFSIVSHSKFIIFTLFIKY